MPRNNGIYTFPVSSWNPATEGQEATPEDYNNQLSDLANAVTTSVATDGSSQITGNIPFSGAKATGLGAGTQAGDSVRYEQVIGVYQPLDATLTALAALSSTSGRAIICTGTDTFALQTPATWIGYTPMNNSRITVSASSPSGGSDGDVWFQY